VSEKLVDEALPGVPVLEEGGDGRFLAVGVAWHGKNESKRFQWGAVGWMLDVCQDGKTEIFVYTESDREVHDGHFRGNSKPDSGVYNGNAGAEGAYRQDGTLSIWALGRGQGPPKGVDDAGKIRE
jgi:hypothetical protein